MSQVGQRHIRAYRPLRLLLSEPSAERPGSALSEALPMRRAAPAYFGERAAGFRILIHRSTSERM